MSIVNQFNGFGGNPGFLGWPNNQTYSAVPQKPLYDPALPNGDCLKHVKGMQSAQNFRMNPNSRDVLFDEDEDILYIVTSDASGMTSVVPYAFSPYKPAVEEEPQYVTMEEFSKFKEEVLNGKQFIRNSKYGNGKPGGKQSADTTDRSNAD
jgi:hypothetical protein